MRGLLIVCILCLFISCNDREPDYEYNPSLGLKMSLEDVPVFEEDEFAFTIAIVQEQIEGTGQYQIRLATDSSLGRITDSKGTVLTTEWIPISVGENEFTFKAIAEGEYPIHIAIKDPYGKTETIKDTIKIVANAPYVPFINSYAFVKQQFDDIWDIKDSTKEQIERWQTLLDKKEIDRDDLLVRFINHQQAKDRPNIPSGDELTTQIQRGYLTLLQRSATDEEIQMQLGESKEGLKTIVKRIFHSQEYQQRFVVTDLLLSITDFVFTTKDNGVLIDDIIPEIKGNLISATIPFGTDITALQPQITTHAGVTVTPTSGSIQDFSSPVTYMATAANGDVQEYTVALEVEEELTSIGVLRAVLKKNPQLASLLNWDASSTDINEWEGVTVANEEITGLNLSDKKLTSVPEEIFQLAYLTKLDLSKNKLTSIPAGIGNLINLEYLNLSSNELELLPPETVTLVKLIKLFLGNNQLTSLPEGIGNLTLLEELSVSNNQLTSLPAEIGNLKQLNVLELGFNKLTTVPTEFRELIQVKVLNIEFNEFGPRVLPWEIGFLTELEELNISGNQLNNLQENIANLSKLRVFKLSHNNFSNFGIVVYRINLTKLHFDYNKLTLVWEEVKNLTQLTELKLNNNQLEMLPPEIGNLVTLEELDVTNNPLISIPIGVCNLSLINFKAPDGLCN